MFYTLGLVVTKYRIPKTCRKVTSQGPEANKEIKPGIANGSPDKVQTWRIC